MDEGAYVFLVFLVLIGGCSLTVKGCTDHQERMLKSGFMKVCDQPDTVNGNADCEWRPSGYKIRTYEGKIEYINESTTENNW